MQMPGRNYSAGYRFGYNGKEKDNEIAGDGNNYDYGARIYDPRQGRFLSVDPLKKKYPDLTPYQFSSNTPIQAIDLDGLEKFTVTGNTITIHMTYVAFCSRSTGSVPSDLDIVEQSKVHWSMMNNDMKNAKYYLDINYDEHGNVTYVTPGETAYTVVFDVKVKDITDENSPEFESTINQVDFTGVYLFGVGEFKGATVQTYGSKVPAITQHIDLSSNNLHGKEATFYKDASSFNKDVEIHEDGHTVGLDHMGAYTPFGSKVPTDGGYMDSYGLCSGPTLTVPGQSTYDCSGMMKYDGADGLSIPKTTQILNILNSTYGNCDE